MRPALLLILWAAAGAVTEAVENALHDSRAALGDAKPCCGHCKRWLYPCPPAMHKGASPTTVSWEDFTAPLPPGAEVEIPCGTRVEVRTDLKAKIGGLRVRGELAFLDGADVELETPHIYVCGLLAAGTVKKPYESSLVITLAAGDDAAALDEDGIDYGTEAFAVFGGLIFLRGAACPDSRIYASRAAVAEGLVPRTTWTRLKRPALPGDGKVRVAGVDARAMRLKGQVPCNTAPAAVAAAAACRLSSSAPVVVFSDERDAGYRQALRDALATGGRRVVLGDEAVRAAVGDADNYFVFAVAAAVLARGSHVLDIRRGHCPGPCVNP